VHTLDFPGSIQFETTSRCNAKCGFCPYPETSKTEPQGTMDDDLFEKIVDEISYYPVRLIQPFLNNDPLMDRKIVTRLEHIIRKNPLSRVSITTNGFLLRPEIARALAAMPLETIHISSNGLTREIYRETMGLDGFAVLSNVNLLWDEMKRQGSPTRLVVTAILMSTNKREVEHMRQYWCARGVTFYLNPLNNRAGNMTPERFRDLLPFDEGANASQLRAYNMSGCPSLYAWMGILWNGDMVRCCMDWRRAKVLGNAREQSLYSLWHGREYGGLRAVSDAGRLNEMPLCGECGENRFSIDPAVLRQVLSTKAESQLEAANDLRIFETIEAFRIQTPELIQLGLIRPEVAK